MGAPQEGGGGYIGGINVTPLVDIVLVLLIIVMVTAPMISRGSLSVSLPKVKRAAAPERGSVRVVVDRSLSVEMDGRRVSREQLSFQLKQMAALNPEMKVSVAADERVSWGEVSALLDEIKGAGIHRIAAEVGTGERR